MRESLGEGRRCDRCENPAVRAGLCWTHVWRQRHQKDMEAEVRRRGMSRGELLTEAALNYADASTDEAFRRAYARLRMAALRYARKPGQERSTA